jgi:voltage-gated potassium channel
MLDKLKRNNVKLYAAIIGMTLLIATGTIFYRFVEGWSWISSMYFSITTLTTVGYGDLYPTTDVSRLFTSCFIVVGVAFFVVALSIVGQKLVDKRVEKVTKGRND